MFREVEVFQSGELESRIATPKSRTPASTDGVGFSFELLKLELDKTPRKGVVFYLLRLTSISSSIIDAPWKASSVRMSDRR